MAEKAKDHQQKLAQSGYTLPDAFYVEQDAPQPSAEQKSGDGGVQASKQQKSTTGYQGETLPRSGVVPAADEGLTVDPETGLTIPSELEGDEPKSGGGPRENKSKK